MENNDLLESGLEINDVAAAHLSETAKWGKFLAIVGIVFCVIFVAIGIGFSLLMSSFSNTYGSSFSVFGPLLGFFYIILAAIYFFPCLLLLRFSNKMKVALQTSDQLSLNDALNNQRRLFKFVGILTIVLIAFYVLFIAVGGLSALLR